MFRNLVLALDASEASNAAMECGIAMAEKFQSTLHAVHVVDVVALEGSLLQDLGGSLGFEPFMNLSAQVQEVLEDKGRAVLERFESRCREAGVQGTTELKRGIVSGEIARYADGKSMVLIGRRGENAKVHEDPVGSVCEGVVRKANVPVWVLNDTWEGLDQIVAGFDGSARATRALEVAADLAEGFAAALDVLSIAPDPGEAMQLVEKARGALRQAGERVEFHGLEGEPKDLLRRSVRDREADLLAVGAFGHNRFYEMLLGSTTETLLRSAPSSLLLCK